MVTFRSNNNRRPPFRSSSEGSKFSNNDNFQRRVPGRNNHNAPKLIEKYNEMAREALANEDRVLSENYFQHAEHFTRVQNEQESIRMAKVSSTPAVSTNTTKNETEEVKEVVKAAESDEVKKIISEKEIKKATKNTEKKVEEKKIVAN